MSKVFQTFSNDGLKKNKESSSLREKTKFFRGNPIILGWMISDNYIYIKLSQMGLPRFARNDGLGKVTLSLRI